MFCWLSLPVAEATDGGWMCFVGVTVKVSGLQGPACWSSTTTKEGSGMVKLYSLEAGAGGC